MVLFSCAEKEEDKPMPSIAAKHEPDLPATPFNYADINLPNYFTTDAGGLVPTTIEGTDNTPSDNPVTNHGATLGRVLFYDKNLSVNGTISCGSCHKQEKGFSDDAIFSVGFEGGLTRRHSMTLINARYYQRGRFFWDERAATLEEQVLEPFQDPVEMGMTLDEVVAAVEKQGFYSDLFEKAFGSTEVNPDRISKALAQFIRSIVSYSSKYDEGRSQVSSPELDFPNFTAEENLGKNIFITPLPNGGGGCFGCHTTEAFIGANVGPQNNGLDAETTVDAGAGEVFENPMFEGRFKTSSLRQIELTAPYMHDGRFDTLEEVVEHYNSGVKNHPTLAPALKNPDGRPAKLHLTDAEKSALVAFMKTLTDESLVTEEKWSDPFKN